MFQHASRIDSRQLQCGPHLVRYLESGHGPTVILLPSMLVLARSYRALVRQLSPRFRVIAPDFPGAGLSSRLSSGWSLEEYSQCLLRVLDALRLERVVVLGHSNSGAVALRFAADAPERTLGAIVADSVGAQPYRNVPRMLAGRAVDAVFEPYFTAYASAHLAFNLMRHGKPFLHQVAIARDTDALAIAERVTAPLLIAWGTKDRTLVPAAAERLHERAPHAEVVWVNGRHDCLVECAAEFAQKILPFLERVTLPRPADHA